MSREIEIKGKDSTGVMRTLLTDSSGNLQIETAGDVAADAADSGNPIKVGGIARTTNPTAVADGDRVSATFDDLGRQVTWPFQVRDLLVTANATLTRGTETAVTTAVASTLVDIVTITGANTSSIAQNISIRTGTGGTVVDQLTIPVTSTVSKTYSVPLLMSEAAQVWTAQNTTQSDLSDSPVSITMVGMKNI